MLLLTTVIMLFFIGITSLVVDSLINKTFTQDDITVVDLDDDDESTNLDFLDLKQDE